MKHDVVYDSHGRQVCHRCSVLIDGLHAEDDVCTAPTTFDDVVDWLAAYLDPNEVFDRAEFAYEIKTELLALRVYEPEDTQDYPGGEVKDG